MCLPTPPAPETNVVLRSYIWSSERREAFSTESSAWLVLLIVVVSALWAVRQVSEPLSRIAKSLDEVNSGETQLASAELYGYPRPRRLKGGGSHEWLPHTVLHHFW